MQITVDNLNKWQEALDNFQKKVKKDLDEIRSCKNYVQSVKKDIINELNKVYYLRDENKLILSAPEIIIGNVDRNGVLLSDAGATKVVVRANSVGLEGVGQGNGSGVILNRAASIQNIAVDPGIDGLENVVPNSSQVVNCARSVILKSENSEGLFTSAMKGGGPGLYLDSDTKISLGALKSNKLKGKDLDALEKDVKGYIKALEKDTDDYKMRISSLLKDLQDLIKDKSMLKNEWTVRFNSLDLLETHETFTARASAIYDSMNNYYSGLSHLAEANRQLECIKEQQERISKEKSKFKDVSTLTSISLNTETVNISSIDGDGNIRDNGGAGFNVAAKNISLSSYAEDGGLLKNSFFSVATEHVDINTSDLKKSDKKINYEAVGSVHVCSKSVEVVALDYEQKDRNKPNIEMTALTKDGSFKVRAENIAFQAVNPEGKAVGQIEANAKDLELKAMDVDKDKGTDKDLAAGSSMLLVADKIFAGSKDKKVKSKMLQLASDKVGVFGETTVELQQKGKAVLQLDGGDVSLGGGKVTFYGNATLQGKTVFKSDVTAETVDMKNLKVKSSFKTPYTSEGMAVPGAPSTAKLNPKLDEEEKKSKKE